MKKICLSILVMILLLIPASAENIRIAAMRGPTAMGLCGLMEKAAEGPVSGNSYEFTLEGSPDAVVPLVVRGDVDIAAIPANLASVLYNRTNGKIQALAINTLGVLYIAEKGNTVQSIDDLRGRTIYSAGKGATPEYALEYVLSANGLEVGKDVFIEWKSEHAECVAALKNDTNGVAMLPQPFAATAVLSDSSIRIALDLNQLWQDATGLGLITGVTIVNRDFAAEHPDAIKAFLSDYSDSVSFVTSDSRAASVVASLGIVPEKAAEAAIPYCNIVMIDGEEMHEALSFYLSVLESQNPQAVGGKAPLDDFYFVQQEV